MVCIGAFFFVMVVTVELELIDDFVEAALPLRGHHLIVSEEGGWSVLKGMGVGEGCFAGDELMDVSPKGFAYRSKLMTHGLPSNNNRIKWSINMGKAILGMFLSSYFSLKCMVYVFTHI